MGAVVTAYCVLPPLVGIIVQFKSRAKDKDMYGKFPGIALVFHVIISGFLIAAAFTWLF